MTTKKAPNYYSFLGLSHKATIEEINQAYRTLAKKFHPDVPKGDEENFKMLAEAYRVLRDPTERERYDATVPGAAKGYIGSPAQIIFDEQFYAYFIGIALVYIGVISLSFFILDLFQFIGLSIAMTLYGGLFFIVLKQIINGDRS